MTEIYCDIANTQEIKKFVKKNSQRLYNKPKLDEESWSKGL